VSASKRYEARCRYCGEAFWAESQSRLDAWIAHHTVNLCEAAKAIVDKAVAEREKKQRS
jgi:hypothetical protein